MADENDDDDFFDTEAERAAQSEIPVTKGETPAKAKDGAETSNVVQHPSAKGGSGNGSSKPPAGQPLEPETAEDDDGQTHFVVASGKESPSLGALVKRGTPVELKVKMTGKAIPGVKGGLIDPYSTSVPVIADCVIDDNDTQYLRNAKGEVESAILYMTLKPRVIGDVRTEQGQIMLREALKAIGVEITFGSAAA